ncbi:MAG: ECF transporter S component [Olsenella sp.]|jgi:riboflavin transporter FmnP|nr:ECF transporter S component [Olsenella sp.]MCI1288856.1 ECF transporter S component [Olsenella sp.]
MAQNSTFARHDTHSTTEQGSGWSTKRIAVTALFCALAAICTLFIEFPILPAVPWLKYDPSAIICLIAGFAFGPATGVAVSIISYLPHIATASGFWGMLMAIIATLAMVLPASLVYKRDTTMRGAIVGMVIGAVVSALLCIVANIIVTPIYAHMSTQAVIALIVPALLPFNVLKVVINAVVTTLVYKPVTKALGN